MNIFLASLRSYWDINSDLLDIKQNPPDDLAHNTTTDHHHKHLCQVFEIQAFYEKVNGLFKDPTYAANE